MTEIHLNDKQKAFIEEQVNSGRFGNADEVIAAALETLRQADENLRKLIQEGLDDMDAGRVHRYEDEDEFLADIKRLSASRQLKTGTGY